MRLGLREGVGVREVVIVVVLGWLRWEIVVLGTKRSLKVRSRLLFINLLRSCQNELPRPPSRGQPEQGAGSGERGTAPSGGTPSGSHRWRSLSSPALRRGTNGERAERAGRARTAKGQPQPRKGLPKADRLFNLRETVHHSDAPSPLHPQGKTPATRQCPKPPESAPSAAQANRGRELLGDRGRDADIESSAG